MKKRNLLLLLLMLLAVPFCQSAWAQNVLEVVSLTRDDNDLRARVTEKEIDDDGNTCALIIVETTLHDGLEFDPDGAGLVKRVDKTGEVWLYVPTGMRQLWIRHADYIACQYTCNQVIEGGVVYRLRLRAGAPGADSNNVALTLNIKTLEAKPRLFLDDKEESMKDGVLTVNLPKGRHTYRVEPENPAEYEMVSGSVDLRDATETRIIELKPKFGLLSINTLPEEGFEVYVNDAYVGLSPLKNHRLFPDQYKVTMKKTDFFPLDADIAVFPGKTNEQTYTLKSTLTNKFPFYITGEYTYTPSSYHGLRVSFGKRWGGYVAYRWGEYKKTGINIDDYAKDVDVTASKELGYVRNSYIGGVRLGVVKSKKEGAEYNALYVYAGGGYGEYGRQWENALEVERNIYYHSDYVKGFEGELGISAIFCGYLTVSAGYSGILGGDKLFGELQLSAGIALGFNKKNKK